MQYFISIAEETWGQKTELTYILVSWDGKSMYVLELESVFCTNRIEELNFRSKVDKIKEEYNAIMLY